MGLGVVDAVAGVVHGDLAGRKLDAVGTCLSFTFTRKKTFSDICQPSFVILSFQPVFDIFAVD